ncbi:MAG: hypothetical protein WCP59_08410 [Actinomycetota bacterium]
MNVGQGIAGRWAGLVVLPLLAVVPLACSSDVAQPGLSAVPVTTIAGPYDYDFTIPAGTGVLLDAGARPAVFPTFLDVKVGDTIRIINDDDRGHSMGTFYVLAKSTLTYRFTTPGVFKGECTVNPGQEFVLTVTE